MPGKGNTRGAVRLVAEIAAVLSFGAGVVHISAAGDHTDVPILFAAFIACAVLQIALGGLLLWRRPSRPLVAAGLALMVGSVAVWLWSRTAGLPVPEDGHQEAVGFKDGITVLFEVGSIPALLLLWSRELDHVSLPSPRLPDQALRTVSLTCCALLVPALTLGGGENHSHKEAVALGLHDASEGHGESESHELAKAGSGPEHKGGSHDADAKQKGHDRAHRRDKDGHSGHTLASAPVGSSHEHAGGSEPGSGAPRHHAGDDDTERHRGGDHGRDRRKGDGHRGGDHGKGHGDGHGDEDGGGQDDEPPITVGNDPLAVCVSGVCVP